MQENEKRSGIPDIYTLMTIAKVRQIIVCVKTDEEEESEHNNTCPTQIGGNLSTNADPNRFDCIFNRKMNLPVFDPRSSTASSLRLPSTLYVGLLDEMQWLIFSSLAIVQARAHSIRPRGIRLMDPLPILTRPDDISSRCVLERYLSATMIPYPTYECFIALFDV